MTTRDSFIRSRLTPQLTEDTKNTTTNELLDGAVDTFKRNVVRIWAEHERINIPQMQFYDIDHNEATEVIKVTINSYIQKKLHALAVLSSINIRWLMDKQLEIQAKYADIPVDM